MRPWPIFVALLTFVFVPARQAAAFLGEDAAGEYAYSDSLNPTDPHSPDHVWESIADTGSSGPSGDDSTGSASIGFEFEFYGTIYEEVVISTNGFITFSGSTGSGCCSGPTIPTAGGIDAFVAGLWSDLTTSGGSIYYETVGSSPSRRFVVEYNNVRFLSSGGTVSFQIVLEETTDDIYIHMVSDGDSTRATTIGIENTDGSDGIQYFAGNTSTIDLDGQTILFSPQRDAPRLGLVTEEPMVPEGGTAELEVTATDRQGDPVTIEWDTDIDGEYDDGEGETITLSAEGLDGPDEIEIGVRASDPAGNFDARVFSVPVVNAPPVFTNVPTDEEREILIGQEWTFNPEVEDPGGDDVEVEVAGRPVGMVLLADGGVRWAPTEEDVGDHTLTFVATDDDDDPDVEGDGDTTLEIILTVSENNPPEAPTIVSPARGEEVTVARPTLVITNPTDPEGDQLRISFEVDTSNTYPAPIASGPIPAGSSGTTEWVVTTDLEDGRRYFWRVWANDGRDDGYAASSNFTVNLFGGEDAGPDADTPDGGPDGDGGAGDGEVAAGCGCRTAAPGSSAPALLLLVLSLASALAVIRRS